MSLASMLGGLALGALTGLGLVLACWPDAGPRPLSLFAALTVALGLGASSCTSFAWRLLPWPIPGSAAILETALAALCLAWGWHRIRGSRRPRPAPACPIDPARPIDHALAVALGLALVLTAGGLVANVRAWPHGGWDAWAFWNVKAKFLHLGGAQWRDMFQPPLHHPDYPLLLPLTVARLWQYQGTPSTLVPQLLAVLWPLLTVGLLGSTLWLRRGPGQATMAALLLLASPRFHLYSTWQMADLPLGMYMLASFCLLWLAERAPESDRSLLVLAGMALGAAAWTKNEGLLFALVVLAASGAVAALSAGPRAARRRLLAMLLGMAPFLACLLVLKAGFAAGNDHLASAAPLVANLLSADRHRELLTWIARSLGHGIDRWLLLLAIGYALLSGPARDRGDRRTAVLIALSLAAMLVAFYLVYAAATMPLTFLLVTSYYRLGIQLLPSAVLLLFVALAPHPAVDRAGRAEGGVRPVCFQNRPEARLHQALRSASPLAPWRLANGHWTQEGT